MKEQLIANALPDPSDWALGLRENIALLRKRAVEKGVDVQRVVTGEVINSIVGDDGNVIYAAIMINDSRHMMAEGLFFSKMRELQSDIQERLETEATTLEVPSDIAVGAADMYAFMDYSDLTTDEGRSQGVNGWKNFRSWVSQLTKEQPDLHEAQVYSDVFTGVFHPIQPEKHI